MSNDQINRRMVEIGFGILLIVIGLALFGADAIATLVFGGLGLYLLYRQFDRSREEIETYRHEAYTAPEAQPRADQVYAHALDAVRSAGLDPNTTHVLPIDIGVMTFSADQDPMIYRTKPVLDDVDYIQPFVQLRLPTRAVGRVRFEILDSDGQVLFIHEDNHQFQRGRNLVTPAARLPIHDAHNINGDWQVRISADGVLLAVHHFGWQESTTKVIRRHIREDGEMSNEVRAMMAESRLQTVSLDELLAEQEIEEGNQRRESGR